MTDFHITWLITGVSILISLIGIYLIVKRENPKTYVGLFLVIIGLASAIYCSKNLQGFNVQHEAADTLTVKKTQQQTNASFISNKDSLNKTVDNKKSLVPLNKTSVEQPYVFYDDFSHGNKNNWSLGNKANESAAIENKALIIDNRSPNSATGRCISFNLDTHKDFTIETQGAQRWGDSISGGYGLIWGRKDGFSFYSFIIDNMTNKYYIGKYEDSKLTIIKSWTISPAIKWVSNKLIIKKHGNTLDFYINDTLVDEESFSAFYGNEIGVYVSSCGNSDIRRVAFSYFKVTGTLSK